MSGRVPVAVLGATGIVGQHLVRLLDGHPWFTLAEVAASESRAGRRYGDAVPWTLGAEPPAAASDLGLLPVGAPLRSPIVLSALPAGVAHDVEQRYAGEGKLVSSNASAHRMRPDVPLLIPEVNAPELELLDRQPWAGSGGALVCNPNCVVAGVALALAPIERRWGVAEGAMVTLQALSGAGLGGPSALELAGNVVPWIGGEEEKIPAELGRVLGRSVPLSVAVNRVPVSDGHIAHLFLRLRRSALPEEVRAELRSFGSRSLSALPTLRVSPLVVTDGPDRPQPRLDVGRGGGMTVTVGRVRESPPHDLALVVLSHNAVRGAAGACLANAEAAFARSPPRVGVA